MILKPLTGAQRATIDKAPALAALPNISGIHAWLCETYPRDATGALPEHTLEGAPAEGLGVAQFMIEYLLGIIDADHPCEQMPLFLLPDPPAVQTPAETMLDLAGAVIAGVHGG